MKNSIKLSFIALAITFSAAACSGGSSARLGDSTQKDSSDKVDTNQAGNVPGANGSSLAIDSGYDKSGSGGTDSIKKEPKSTH